METRVRLVILQYREQRIAIEYDGDIHRISRKTWLRDMGVRELLRELGWEVIVLTSDDVFYRRAALSPVSIRHSSDAVTLRSLGLRRGVTEWPNSGTNRGTL